jgi:hypothetical protein
MPLELRAVIHFLWLKQTPSQAILSEFDDVYGKDMITMPAVEKWTAGFDSSRPLLCPCPGGLVTLERSTISMR